MTDSTRKVNQAVFEFLDNRSVPHVFLTIWHRVRGYFPILRHDTQMVRSKLGSYVGTLKDNNAIKLSDWKLL